MIPDMIPEEQAKGREPAELELPTTEEGLRELAVRRLRKRADFRTHVVVYLATNALLVAVWWATGAAFFWPVFPIAIWGIGLVAHAWEVHGPNLVTEARVREEMDRLRR